MIEATNRHRPLTPEQRMGVKLKLVDIMRRRAKERHAEGSARGGKARVNLPEPSDNIVPFPTDSAQVRDEIAKAAGWC